MRRALASLSASAIAVVGIASSGGSGFAAAPKQEVFTATVRGTATVTWQASGNLLGGGGCHEDVAGGGSETFSFASVRAQEIDLVDEGRGRYLVFTEYRKPAPVRFTAKRSGGYTVTFPQSNPSTCSLQPTTLTAPEDGCGALAGRAVLPRGSTIIYALGIVGTRGVSRPSVEVARVGGWDFAYELLPWLEKLDPCPSSMEAVDQEHLGTGWSQGRRLWPGGGGLPYQKTGNNRIPLPAGFWRKSAFVVKNRFVWSFRALNVDVHQIGNETQAISWTMTFKRRH